LIAPFETIPKQTYSEQCGDSTRLPVVMIGCVCARDVFRLSDWRFKPTMRPPVEGIFATYLIETPLPVEKAAATLAGEQSSGTGSPNAGKNR
jgi:hypothetical protein